MTTLGVTFPAADDSVKYAVQQMNKVFELGRKTACSAQAGGMKQLHQVMLHVIEQARADLKKMGDIPGPPCDQIKVVEKAFAIYKGPVIPFFDEWKLLFLSMESDWIDLICSENKADLQKALDNYERLTRSSYKSICGSDEVITTMSPEAAMESTNQLARQLAAASEATANAAEESGLNVEPVIVKAGEALASVSCPSGFAVLTTHYQIMLVVLLTGFAIAFLISKKKNNK